MINYIIMGISVLLLCCYVLKLKKEKFTTKKIVIISMFSGLAFILHMIPFVKYPQGGGITLFSMLPTMLLAILYGNAAGLTGGAIFGLLKLINGVIVVHPAQFLLDYILATMALGLAGSFGNDKKYKIAMGGLLAVILSVLVNVISGAVYFGQYAPKGMNVWLYSIIYNVSGNGVEGILSVILLVILPIKRLKINE
ncbi:energy-coupled thiamine transporter ThiT [Clostridium botulinum]|uniref:Probable proton-coupled thiamine transporter YuaJ n=1 Tax=Clostridium botulinum D str. 1873 TaxID=592027 RepID=A0A9P2G7Q7_CLOBO|nr:MULTISPECIES: energy-coupled thiamine transporter ThiT [Clostridium]AYF53497.1 energy-coupled thiamine transporter ThiT [Clostridium novyi]EES91439.1 probable proton-coupled thiamine transporter YuaJ [Clostridium botulinum D str. 1873]MBO3441067.1 energy-coupled thiamine transporter ThiT [Clostridium haemolyticum]MCD3246516.1 energy-coupled thiamine transporter ThiT [Clostridium botulinum C]MCD3262879.1 energy-coupled thiamine transporter ThiT [Clostridium botulinum C]